MAQLKLLLVVLLGSLWVKVAEGCSCMLAHPQESFCWSSYVIKAKVVNKEWIPMHAPTTVSPDESQNDVQLTSWMEEPMAAARWPYPPRASKLVYTVFVEKVYKGEQHVTPKQLVKIVTAPDGAMCGLTHLAKKQRYVISGSVMDGELRAGLCNFVNNYSSLTKRQKQGLKYHWKRDCGICMPANCMWEDCYGKDACSYEPNRGFECMEKYARCTQDRQGNCNWYGKRDYEECRGQQPRRQPFLP